MRYCLQPIMSGEGEFAKSSKKKHKTFNQRKERWLMKKLSREGPSTEEEVQARLARLPLKYRALSTLLRDGSNEDLLAIKKVLDDILLSRPQRIEIVLKRKQHEAASDWGRDIYNELGRIIARDYVRQHFPDLDKKIRRQLATYLSWNLELPPDDPPSFPPKSAREYQKLIDTYQKLLDDYNRRSEEQRTIREKISEELINVLGEERLNTIDEDFQEIQGKTGFNNYYSDEPDDPYLIRALKNLERRKVEVKTMLLYTLELPLGASYEIGFDDKYGEYPIISGCHY